MTIVCRGLPSFCGAALVLLLTRCTACSRGDPSDPRPRAASDAASLGDAAFVTALAATATASPANPLAFAAVPPLGGAGCAIPPPRSADGGRAACRLLRGPIELPVRGPVALSPHNETMDVILNDDGRPRLISLPVGAGPFAAPSGLERASGDVTPGLSVGCAVAGDQVFCPDRSGAVHRSSIGSSPTNRVVASSRAGTRVTADRLDGSHTLLGYLATRKTSEGWVSEAWVAMDDAAPIRISEDGSGATSIALRTRGHSALALMVDARAALTALHIRLLRRARDLEIAADEDVVAFVGGPGDRRTSAVLEVPLVGPAWALLPIAKDVGNFGLAIVRLDSPPHVDEPVEWSMYPNGLDPAPVAAAHAGGHTWVARVRPKAREPAAPKEIELGELLDGGQFVERDIVESAEAPTDIAVTFDARGALWIGWVDSSGSWLERLFCH